MSAGLIGHNGIDTTELFTDTFVASLFLLSAVNYSRSIFGKKWEVEEDVRIEICEKKTLQV